MASDPKPGTAKHPDGSENKDLEQRLGVLFGVTAGTNTLRPTDADSALAFVQELWDRLNGGRRAR